MNWTHCESHIQSLGILNTHTFHTHDHKILVIFIQQYTGNKQQIALINKITCKITTIHITQGIHIVHNHNFRTPAAGTRRRAKTLQKTRCNWLEK